MSFFGVRTVRRVRLSMFSYGVELFPNEIPNGFGYQSVRKTVRSESCSDRAWGSLHAPNASNTEKQQ